MILPILRLKKKKDLIKRQFDVNTHRPDIVAEILTNIFAGFVSNRDIENFRKFVVLSVINSIDIDEVVKGFFRKMTGEQIQNV